MSNLKNTEVLIGLWEEELWVIFVWEEAYMDFEWKTLTWTVVSISPVADNNLQYSTKIMFSQQFKKIGWLVNIRVPVTSKRILLPLNIIEVKEWWKWIISTFSGGILQREYVELWKIWWDTIEVIYKNKPNLMIITTDMSHYDEKKNQLVVRWTWTTVVK
jgi:hypothetical protein